MDTEFFNFWQSDQIVDFIRFWPKNGVFGHPKWSQTQYSWGAEYGKYNFFLRFTHYTLRIRSVYPKDLWAGIV